MSTVLEILRLKKENERLRNENIELKKKLEICRKDGYLIKQFVLPKYNGFTKDIGKKPDDLQQIKVTIPQVNVSNVQHIEMNYYVININGNRIEIPKIYDLITQKYADFFLEQKLLNITFKIYDGNLYILGKKGPFNIIKFLENSQQFQQEFDQWYKTIVCCNNKEIYIKRGGIDAEKFYAYKYLYMAIIKAEKINELINLI